jgi:hypothetical protein
MSFEIHLKDNIGNDLSKILADLPKIITVQTLQITDGFLVKGNYRIPIEHILFIKEV